MISSLPIVHARLRGLRASASRALGLAVFAAVVCVAPVAAGVIVVDAGGGGDATDVQAAVDLAAEGDVLLVKPGTYGGFRIDGKSLHVVADGSGVSIGGSVTVHDLGAAQRVTLDGLDVQLPFTVMFNPPTALVVDDCAGSVRAERSEFRALSAVNWDFCDNSFWPDGPDAARVVNSADVVFASCTFVGGQGFGSTNPMCYGKGSDGGRGLLVEDSNVGLHEVVARGADGRIEGQGGIGGTGLEVAGSSEVLASGVFAEGGDGGISTDFIGGPPNGDGGIGVLVAAGATLRVAGGAFTGGVEGTSCCWTTSPGANEVIAGTRVDLTGAPRRLLTSSPTREGGTLTLSINGAPGDQVSLLIGFLPAHLPLPKFSGTLYVDPSTMLGPLPIATLAGASALVPLSIPELPPGLDAAALDMQLFVVDGSGGPSVLTAPGVAVLLDETF